MPHKKIFSFCIAVAICLLVGYFGLFYSTLSISTWYAGLQKLDFTPSFEVFIPIWTIFYILMGISLYLIIQSGKQKHDVRHALILFGLALLLNICWFLGFFGLHSAFLGLVMMLLLWTALLCTIILVFRFSVPAAGVLVPCLGWISFIAYLNYAILVLNPGSFGLSF